MFQNYVSTHTWTKHLRILDTFTFLNNNNGLYIFELFMNNLFTDEDFVSCD